MILIFPALVILILLFGFVLLFGAPFVPTLQVRTTDAFDLLDLHEGQTMLELGSGDGRMLREAAKRGIHTVGYELNPLLVLWSYLSNWKYRRYITVHWGNFWHKPLPETDGIYVFLLDKYMQKLDKKIEQDKQRWPTKKRLKVVSFAFAIPNKRILEERSGMMLYLYK